MTDFFTKIKNKVAYTIENLINDPAANAFAQEKEKEKEKEKEDTKQSKESPQTQGFESPTTEDSTTDSNENKSPEDETIIFRMIRIFKNTGNSILDHAITYGSILLGIIFAMIVANEMIVYAAPVRVIFFIFVIALCAMYTPVNLVLGLLYLYKFIYSKYTESYIEEKDRPKIPIFPKIYALLPVTTFKPESSVLKFLLYLFTYPKSYEESKSLIQQMESYKEMLIESFPYYKTLQSNSTFKPLIEKMDGYLTNMHISAETIEEKKEENGAIGATGETAVTSVTTDKTYPPQANIPIKLEPGQKAVFHAPGPSENKIENTIAKTAEIAKTVESKVNNVAKTHPPQANTSIKVEPGQKAEFHAPGPAEK